jgi:hypothetical protein
MRSVVSNARNVAHATLLCAVGGALLSLSAPSMAASTTLTIGGKPATTVTVSGNYSFQPTAKDTVKSRIKFDIYNKPSWATFDGTTGLLSGRPNHREVGTYSNITIRLTDWYGFVTTPPFSITVLSATVTPPPVKAPPVPPPVSKPSSNNVALDWTPPTDNTDGSMLTNLAGYNVHYGTSPDKLTNVIKLTNPGLASYVVDNLTSGTWYFAITSYASSGAESAASAVVSTKIL